MSWIKKIFGAKARHNEMRKLGEKRSNLSLAEFKADEVKDRTEWLFWNCFMEIENNLDNLHVVFQVDGLKWKNFRQQIFYETILWSFGNSVAVLRGVWNKKLTEEDINEIVFELIFFLEMFFPPHKDYEIIDIFSNYVIASALEKDHKKIRYEMESYYIQRVCHLLKLDYDKLNQQENRDVIFSKFPWGWVLASDGFAHVTIGDIKTANITSRQHFRRELLEAKRRSDKSESAEEAQKRHQWEENTEEFCKLTEASLNEIEDEIKRRSDLEDMHGK